MNPAGSEKPGDDVPVVVPADDVNPCSPDLTSIGSVDVYGFCDGWFYYSYAGEENWKVYGDVVYRMRADGTGKMKVIKLNELWKGYYPAIHMYGEFIFFTNPADGGALYKMRLDGTEKTKLNNEGTSFLDVSDGWAYYLFGQEGSICRVRTDGTGREVISESGVGEIAGIADGWIYYKGYEAIPDIVDGKLITVVYKDTGSYKMRTNGTEITKIADDLMQLICIDEGWVYYFNLPVPDEDGYTRNTEGTRRLHRMRLDGTGKIELDEKPNSYRDQIFFSEGSDLLHGLLLCK